MILRDATAADVPAIAAIWNPIVRDTAITFWPDERSDDQIAALIAEPTLGNTFGILPEPGFLEGLRRVFPYLDCERTIDGQDARACLYFDMKLCGGPRVWPISCAACCRRRAIANCSAPTPRP